MELLSRTAETVRLSVGASTASSASCPLATPVPRHERNRDKTDCGRASAGAIEIVAKQKPRPPTKSSGRASDVSLKPFGLRIIRALQPSCRANTAVRVVFQWRRSISVRDDLVPSQSCSLW
jgi:hypothetical protein